MSYTYDVFFSYRHKPLDSQITEKLFNMVESYRLPEPLRARGCQDVHRAFRDTEELAVSRILTDTIDKALHSTNCLVVVCSEAHSGYRGTYHGYPGAGQSGEGDACQSGD